MRGKVGPFVLGTSDCSPSVSFRNLSLFGVRLSWEESAVRARRFAREWPWYVLPKWQVKVNVGWSPVGAL